MWVYKRKLSQMNVQKSLKENMFSWNCVLKSVLSQLIYIPPSQKNVEMKLGVWERRKETIPFQPMNPSPNC